MTTAEYELLLTTRYDPLLERLGWNYDELRPSPFLLLRYHYDRIVDAVEQHGWTETVGLSYSAVKMAAQEAVSNAADKSARAYKVRLTLSRSGTLTASAMPTPPLAYDPTSPAFFKPNSDSGTLYGQVLAVTLDSEPTPASLFTSTKTTRRQVYDDARSRAALPPIGASSTVSSSLAEVILHNEHGAITEASVSNVAFYRSPHWITPRLSTGCLPGVLRRWMLEQGRIREAPDDLAFTLDNVRPGDWVLILNSVSGCRVGRIQEG
ncbi:D-aminoacid aminotransferase-like PLP-dependent enzyme [Guyanagaster necrorhizus]|uniref:D-aminoacid aminotransferase-like PLP-dependent enzyme n=1 Tax=Guyanagaster necrorhizus TaxID=856835 RepID=A0A9P7W2N7_9AGAR|nr:D-aminoacid aminotransferase-like PLP-dependent enzyme [Guyanagaster necrorhizus MCA 3950]KAG7452236.1 D-aminoacid aminotransferase-like PLP-dependent enzyme [Guyanagaster necrorhizus MCA 3950]